MKHIYLGEENDDHYAIATNGDGGVLLQTGDETGQQARILMNPRQALGLIKRLSETTAKALKELAASKSITTLLVLCFLLPVLLGCRSYYYQRTDAYGTKHELWIQTLLSDASLAELELRQGTNMSLNVKGYSQEVNSDAVKAITEGVVEGVMGGIEKAVKPGL